jgi:hypothetical protein
VSNGGIIGPPNVPTQDLASGVWTLGEQYLARVADIWPLWVPDVVRNDSVLWLDAADLSTITESGGSVSQWDNKGSLGNFTQATAALQPTTGASTLNGLNVLDFAGDILVSANSASVWKFLHDGTNHIIAAVWKPGTTTDDATNYALISSIDGGAGSSDVGLQFAYTGAVATNSATHFVARGVSGSFVINNNSGSGFLPSGNFTVMTVDADPDNATAADRSEMFANAGTAVKNNTAANAVSTANPSETLRIGASLTTLPLTGSIAELVIVSGADATEGNRVIIRDYLNAKWGVYA